MPLLALHGISIAFGGPPILDGIDLNVEAKERLCIVGRNGEGKSTLMKIIAGELTADTGEVVRNGNLRISRLDQELAPNVGGNIIDVARTGAPQAPVYQLESIVTRLGLNPHAPFRSLSGGLKRRALLARALANDPELLLLDEPTNHLDLDTIAWLEKFLQRWHGTVIFVSHDRALVRHLTTRIVELDRGAVYSYPGSYDSYEQQRMERLATETKKRTTERANLAREEIWARQSIAARRTRNEGRMRALEKLRRQYRQQRLSVADVRIRIGEAERSGALVFQIKDLSFSYSGAPLLQGFSALVTRGDRIGIIGPNGSGKTTLLRLMLGELKPSEGRVRHGTRLRPLHFDQFRGQLNPAASVVENIAGGQEYIELDGRQIHVYGYLQDFLFTPDRARCPVSMLSGGERNRLLLAQLFRHPTNLLVLDEPTNDLDTDTLDLFEERLSEFKGTLLLVSHDRDFLDRVVTSTWVMEDNGRIGEYVGGYTDWQRQRSADHGEPTPPAQPETATCQRREGRPVKLTFNERRELNEMPDCIEKLEAEHSALQNRLADPSFYRNESNAIGPAHKRLQVLERKLETAYSRWEDLTAKAER